jgi:hypothetical protein
MRSVSSLAVLATSLLVRDVVAGRYDVRKRDLYVEVDEVVVTAEVIVTDEGSGNYATGAPVMIGTVTIDGTPVLVTETTSSSTSTTPVAVPASTSLTVENAIFVQTSSTSTPVYVAPTTSTTPVYVAPTTSTTPVAEVAATTFAKVASAAKTTSAVATTTASSSSSAKRGVAYNDASLTDAFASAGLVSWAYNWGSSTSSIASTLEYVPMLWGLDTSDITSWVTKATAAIASGSTHLLAFNEPDYSGQANLGYAAAAAGYLTYMQPFASKAKLGSPAVTNGGDPMGLTWLANFVSACSTCTIDFVAIHWYNGGTAADFQAYITKAYAAGGNRPLWITEFEASGTTAEQQAFLETMLPWLDASDMVERYAYFMAADGNLISGTSLSALGTTYATYV